MPPKKGGGGGRQKRRTHSLDPTNQRTKAPLSSTTTTTAKTTAKTTKEPSAQNTMFIKEQRPTRLGPNIAPLILEGAKLNKMELNDVIKSHFGDVNIRNIQLGKTGAFTIQAGDYKTFNHLLKELTTAMASKGHESTKVFVPRSIQRIKDTEKVAFVKRVDVEIPTERIIESIKNVGLLVTKVDRLIGKDGKTPTRTVRVTFEDVGNRTVFIKYGLQVDYMHFDAEPARQNTKPTQCFLCFKFNHVAKYCKAEVQTCDRCSGNHRKDQCSATDDQIKCVNCKGKHEATSTDCGHYQEQVKKMKNAIDKYSSQCRTIMTPPAMQNSNDFPDLPQPRNAHPLSNLQGNNLDEFMEALTSRLKEFLEGTTYAIADKLSQRISRIEKVLQKLQVNLDETIDPSIISTENDMATPREFEVEIQLNNNMDLDMIIDTRAEEHEEENISEQSSDEECRVLEHIQAKRAERESGIKGKSQIEVLSTPKTPSTTTTSKNKSKHPKKKKKTETVKREHSTNSSSLDTSATFQ